MGDHLPLPTLLSFALVAFTIELDNEFEHRMPHRTSKSIRDPNQPVCPWLTSVAMWFNCMRYAYDEGVSVGDLHRLARTRTNLNGMIRWRYVKVAPPGVEPIKKPSDTPFRALKFGTDWMITTTSVGRQAKAIWEPLPAEIESRWRSRFGEANISDLKDSLKDVIGQFDVELPDCMPILGYGLTCENVLTSSKQAEPLPGKNLIELLAKALIMFAREYEMESSVSLAIGANVLRLVGYVGIALRDLPRLASISKESVAIGCNWLERHGYATSESNSRTKRMALTETGNIAKREYECLLADIEKRWTDRYGAKEVDLLKERLEALVVTSTSDSPLFQGLIPYPDGWRASVAKPVGLPHFPMVLHRGGYPDGS